MPQHNLHSSIIPSLIFIPPIRSCLYFSLLFHFLPHSFFAFLYILSLPSVFLGSSPVHPVCIHPRLPQARLQHSCPASPTVPVACRMSKWLREFPECGNNHKFSLPTRMSGHNERKEPLGTYEFYLYENLTNPTVIFTDESIKRLVNGASFVINCDATEL